MAALYFELNLDLEKILFIIVLTNINTLLYKYTTSPEPM